MELDLSEAADVRGISKYTVLAFGPEGQTLTFVPLEPRKTERTNWLEVQLLTMKL